MTGRIQLPAEQRADGAASIAIRPHSLSVAPADSSHAGDRVWVDGTITHREFLGEFVRYRIDARGTEFVADQSHFSGGVEFMPGSAVKVGIAPAQVEGAKISVCHGVGRMFTASGTVVFTNEA